MLSNLAKKYLFSRLDGISNCSHDTDFGVVVSDGENRNSCKSFSSLFVVLEAPSGAHIMNCKHNSFLALAFTVMAALALTGCLEALPDNGQDAGNNSGVCPSGVPVMSVIDKDQHATEGGNSGSFLITVDQNVSGMTVVLDLSGIAANRHRTHFNTDGWAEVLEPDELEALRVAAERIAARVAELA